MTQLSSKIPNYLFVLILVPCLLYLITTYIPGGVYTVYTLENTTPSYLQYIEYVSGNMSCTQTPVQPWYYAQTTTPLLVFTWGTRIKLLAESGFRIKAGTYGQSVHMLTQHYLFIQVSRLEDILTIQKEYPPSTPLKVLYLYSTPVRDFTDYAFGKELRGDGYGSAKTFISDWEYNLYVLEHTKVLPEYHLVNTTDYSDADVLQVIYDFLPQVAKYYPIEKYVTCAYSFAQTTQELSFEHRCNIYSERYPVLRGEVGGGGGGNCKLIT